MTQAQKMREQGYLTILDVAKALGVHVTSIYRLLNLGRVESIRVGRARYVNRASVIAYYKGIDEKTAALFADLPVT